jgi:DNA-binding MarR family transcriptional regulator
MPRDMQSELRQNKPFAAPEEELFLSLVRTADLLGRKLSALLKIRDLSPAQYNVLRILRGAGNKGLPCGEIGARMVTRDPDVTRILDRLERRKLVSRERGAGDRRVVSTCITPAGMSLLKTLDAPLMKIHREQLGFLAAGAVQELLGQLTHIRDRLAKDESDPDSAAAGDTA